MNPRLILLAFLSGVVLLAGCNTLSSLGLPGGASRNKILPSAKAIADQPGQSLLQPKELAQQPLPEYVLQIGDTVLLEPVKFDASIRLPGDQVIPPDGNLSLGEFGRLFAAGKTIQQLESECQARIDAKLTEQLQTEFEQQRAQRTEAREPLDPNPDLDEDVPLQTASDQEALTALQLRIQDTIQQNKVSARLINWDSQRIYVLGEVNSPGSFNYLGNETALDAIIEAGGLTSRANHHEIILARATPCDSCRVVMKICYDQLVQLGDASTNYQLRPGDRLFVPSLTFKDDLRQTLRLDRDGRCPRCSNCPQACDLPQGCEGQLVR